VVKVGKGSAPSKDACYPEHHPRVVGKLLQSGGQTLIEFHRVPWDVKRHAEWRQFEQIRANQEPAWIDGLSAAVAAKDQCRAVMETFFHTKRPADPSTGNVHAAADSLASRPE
jgi:hypothetical protein